MLSYIFEGNALLFFLLDIFVTIVIVQAVISSSEKKHWRNFRQNYADNLLSRTKELIRIYESGLMYFPPYRDEVGATSQAEELNQSQYQYQLDTGTSIRAFEASIRMKRNDIRQSMEIGFHAINAELAVHVGAYKQELEDLIEFTQIMIQLDEEAGTINGEVNQRRVDLKELTIKLKQSSKLKKKFNGESVEYAYPFEKLYVHLSNFSYDVESIKKRSILKFLQSKHRTTDEERHESTLKNLDEIRKLALVADGQLRRVIEAGAWDKLDLDKLNLERRELT